MDNPSLIVIVHNYEEVYNLEVVFAAQLVPCPFSFVNN